MLGARIDVVEASIWNFNAYLLPLPQNKMTTDLVKWDKTSGLHRNHCQTWSCLQRTLLFRKGSIKYCILLLWARLKIFCISRICRAWNNVVCKTIKLRFICLIICNCKYIVVINCGWNNIVAVKIVACWNWDIYTSSWLDRHFAFFAH